MKRALRVSSVLYLFTAVLLLVLLIIQNNWYTQINFIILVFIQFIMGFTAGRLYSIWEYYNYVSIKVIPSYNWIIVILCVVVAVYTVTVTLLRAEGIIYSCIFISLILSNLALTIYSSNIVNRELKA